MGLRRQQQHGTPASAQRLREVQVREFTRDAAGLLDQLRLGEPEQRRWAARDLAVFDDTAGALGERLLAEPDPSVREALFGSLEAMASEAAAAALLPLLRSEDAGLRNGAIEALSAMPRAVAPRIDALLADPDVDVRIFTVNLMGDLRHPRVVEWLARVLRHDEDVNVVAAAIEVMAETGEPQHVAALQAACERFASDPFIEFAARMAAQRIESA